LDESCSKRASARAPRIELGPNSTSRFTADDDDDADDDDADGEEEEEGLCRGSSFFFCLSPPRWFEE
jgi:hypothetical protein